MSRIVHVIGNGDNSALYKPAKGIKITCNLPPFSVENVYGSCMVDFKMMRAMHEGSVQVPGEWILGFRPHKYLEMYPSMRLQWANQIKEFYLDKPPYVANYTDFNCGHMAVHYSANKLKGTEIHMYGFDSIFDFSLRSCTDFYLQSDRGDTNNMRLINNWRPIWNGIFNQFSETQFVLHHKHADVKIKTPENVEVVTK